MTVWDEYMANGVPRIAAKPVQHFADELPWETNPPHAVGFEVRRDHGGGVQVVAAAHDDPDVVAMLGGQYFASGESDPAPGQLCGCGCGEPLLPGKAGKRYNGGVHRIAASRRRRREANASS
jgi:hypothetical protein